MENTVAAAIGNPGNETSTFPHFNNARPEDDINIVANIAYYPSKDLRAVSKRIENFEEIKTLIDLMFLTMTTGKGVGLSANQIGIHSQLFVMRTPDMRKAFINPKLTPEGDAHSYTMRDLSFPGIEVRVKRYEKVRIDFQDQFGDDQSMVLTGTEAVVAQQQCEHLQGKTFIDNLSLLRRKLIENKVKKTVKQWQHGKKNVQRKLITV